MRRWYGKFGQTYAGALRRRQPQPGDKWHLDEVFIKINGERKYQLSGSSPRSAASQPTSGPAAT